MTTPEQTHDEIDVTALALELGRFTRNGNVENCRKCLSLGANVQGYDGWWSPLLEAVKFGEPEICALLIDAGADLKIRDSSGRGVMHWASYVTNMQNCADTFSVLLSSGADIDMVDADDETALMTVAKYEKLDAMHILINARCNLELKNRYSQTALHLAAIYGNTKACEVLIASGADSSATCSGMTAEMFAQQNKFFALAEQIRMHTQAEQAKIAIKSLIKNHKQPLAVKIP